MLQIMHRFIGHALLEINYAMTQAEVLVMVNALILV